MSFRLTTAAGFLAAASLLGSSALAQNAPRFVPDGGLTTVIITDRTAAPASVTTPFDRADGPGATTQNIFRFTNAYDILQEVDLNGNNPEDIRIIFNEFFDDTFVDPVDRRLGTLLINGQRAFALGRNRFPSVADFAAAPTLASYNDPRGFSQGALSFQNRDINGDDENFSPSDVFSLTGTVTGETIAPDDPQFRLVQLYVGTNTAADLTGNIKSFFVFTSIDDIEGDSVEIVTAPTVPTAPASPWTPAIPATTNFSDFIFFGEGRVLTLPVQGRFGFPALNQLQTASTAAQSATLGANRDSIGTTADDLAGVVAGPSIPPPANTPITLTVPTDKVAAVFWAKLGVTLEANTVYELRANITRLNAGNDNIRLSLGAEEFVGVADALFADAAAGQPNIPVNQDVLWRNYLSTKGTTTNAGVLKFDLIGFGFASPNGANAGGSFRVSSYELRQTTRAALEALPGTQIIYNRGGAIPTPAAGEIAPPPAPTGDLFAEASRPAITFQTLATFNTHQRNSNTLVEAGDGSLNFNINPPNAIAAGTTDTFPAGQGFPFNSLVLYSGAFAAATPTTPGLVPVRVGNLYAMDVWVSSAQTGEFPALRVFPRTGISQVDSVTFPLRTANPTGISTAPRAYTSIFTPQPFGLGLQAGDVVRFAPTLDFLQVDDRPLYSTLRTVRIHRIVVTEFPSVALD